MEEDHTSAQGSRLASPVAVGGANTNTSINTVTGTASGTWMTRRSYTRMRRKMEWRGRGWPVQSQGQGSFWGKEKEEGKGQEEWGVCCLKNHLGYVRMEVIPSPLLLLLPHHRHLQQRGTNTHLSPPWGWAPLTCLHLEEAGAAWARAGQNSGAWEAQDLEIQLPAGEASPGSSTQAGRLHQTERTKTARTTRTCTERPRLRRTPTCSHPLPWQQGGGV